MSRFDFDKHHDIEGNNFVRTNKEALQTLFGGTSISPFWIADMEFKINDSVIDEIKRIADRGVFSYEKPMDDLYPIMCNWFDKRHQLQLNPDRFQIVTGVLTGIAVIVQEYSKPGEGVMIQSPVYHQFKKIIEGNDRKLISNSLTLKDGRYHMDLIDMEEKLKSGDVKILVICNPHNPMGRVWTRDELEKVVDLARKYDVFLMSDEIHSDILLNGHKFTSMMEFGYDQSAALLGSPAKTFGMQSSACGFIYSASEEVHQKLFKKIEAMYLFHLSTITVHATRMAYLKASPWVDAMIMYINQTLEWMHNFVEKELHGVHMIKSEATYQVWLDFRELGLSDIELDELIIHDAGVGLTPGHWFGPEGSGFMRMNIGSPKLKIMEAMADIKNILPH